MNESTGIFSKFFYSIVSFDKYRYFLRQSTGKVVVYLLLLSLIISVATFIPSALEYNRIMDDVIANLGASLPDFSLVNGKLEVKGEMPIIFDDGTIPVIIDTTPGAEERYLDDYDAVLLITRDKFIQKNYVDRRVTDLSAFQGMELTKESFERALPLLKPIGVIIFIFAGIFFICGKFISAWLISLIGLTINSIKNTNLSYRSIYKISIYAMTLPLIVGVILSVLPFQVPYQWLIFYAISGIYVFGAINSIKKEIDNVSYDDGPINPEE